MPTTAQREQTQKIEQLKRETLHALIGEQLIHTLGEPGDLLRVDVRPLWENYYRVNVLVGADIASPRIANSYFLAADGEGNILAATPKLTRQY
jgi:hypothetical protein